MDELRAMLGRLAVSGPERLMVHTEDEDDDLFWVGTKELYHGMRSEVRLASAMHKDVADLLLAALLKERDGG
ncbi:unnamed protein product [Gemmataceae bacterium]|nr:unnamed protein product [Gemmataceae bacterium]VTU01033.1 unnamed protein product [Gemmataceae bacterium]